MSLFDHSACTNWKCKDRLEKLELSVNLYRKLLMVYVL